MSLGFILSGFFVGLVGSFHCIGMCGPLALALPVHHLNPLARFISLFLYQTGRVVTYSVLGLLVASAGQGFRMAGLQQYFSIAVGIIMLLMVVMQIRNNRIARPGFLNKVFRKVQSIILGILQGEKSTVSFLFLGLANGLLPCGMVYLALATASTANMPDGGGMFMAMFGLGTIPMMMLISYVGQLASLQVRKKIKRLIPAFMIMVSLILIVRGLGLGIPYLSPDAPGSVTSAASCHG